MDLFDVARSCARRWYVFIPLCLCALAFGYRAYTGVHTVYYGSTTLGMASPSFNNGPGQQGPVNGLANTGGLTLVANLLTLSMSDGSVRQQVAAQGGLYDYSATVFQLPGGAQLPLVVIAASAPDPESVSRTLDIAAAQGSATLHGIQVSAGVPDVTMLQTYPIVPAGAPIPGTPSRMKSTIAILFAGLGLSVVTTVLVDVFFVSRKKRRAIAAQRDSGLTFNSEEPPNSTNGSSKPAATDDLTSA